MQQALAVTQNPNLIPALLLLGALVIPVTFVVYLDGRNPAFDVPLITLLLCGLIGGVLGVVIAGLGEAHALRDLGALPTLVIGLIEEAAKLIVPLAVLMFTRYRATTANGLLIRGLASPAGHATWTGLAAAALWRAAHHRWRPRALAAFAGVFLLVVVLHGLWDALCPIGNLAVGILSLVLLTRQVHRDVLTTEL